MSNENKTEWDTDLSGFTDYEGVIVDAWAAFGEQGTNMNANMKFQTSDPDNPEWTEKYGMGADWNSYDGGESVENKKSVRFKDNSGYGQFINAACDLIAVDEKGEPLTGQARFEAITDVLGDSPRVMSVWVGTSWFMEAREGSFENRETGQKVKYAKNYPTKFLGKVEVNKVGGHSSEPGQVAEQNNIPVESVPTTVPTTEPTTTPVANNGNPLSVLSEANLNMATQYAKALEPDAWRDKMVEIISSQGLIGTPDGDNMLLAVSGDTVYEQLKAN